MLLLSFGFFLLLREIDRRLCKFQYLKSSVLVSLAMKNVNQVFLGFLDFSSVPRFSSFLLMAWNAVVLHVYYLLIMLDKEYTNYSNITIVFRLHTSSKNPALGQSSIVIEKVGATSVVMKNRLCKQEDTRSERRMGEYKCTIKCFWLTTQSAVSFALP